MKRSTYHEVIGALICNGHKGLAEQIVSSSNEDVLKTFLNPGSLDQKSRKPVSGHLKIDTYGDKSILFDYDTPICAIKSKGTQIGTLWLNTDTYSITTTKVQRYIKEHPPSYTKIKEVSEPELKKIIYG